VTPTFVEETLRLDVQRKSAGEIIATVVALLDRQQRGWRVREIAVTIERPVDRRVQKGPGRLLHDRLYGAGRRDVD
jgi:hypothetical protein